MADGVGFNTSLEILERAAYVAKIVPSATTSGTYQVGTLASPLTPTDADEPWRTLYHSAGFFNLPHRKNAKVDQLIETAAASYDAAVRKKTYAELDQLTFDDPWYGYLWSLDWNYTF